MANNKKYEELEKLARLVRYFILESTTEAGSGHPTSSLSATDLMTVLLFGGFFRFYADQPAHPNNDRLVFSKGHASPLLYALWGAAGKITEQELLTLRKFGSRLEGHPTPAFPYADAATGSLGQGLSIGVGMALNAKYLDKLPYRTYVLLGDSEMAEGSQWEAMEIAAYYKLDNLIGIIDVNRLGQRGPTMYERNLDIYKRRVTAFGWKAITVDGHNLAEISASYRKALRAKDQPAMIIAGTVKGKGVSFIEDKNGWHGKALSREDYQKALTELGEINKEIRGKISRPKKLEPERLQVQPAGEPYYDPGKPIATRKAYGHALRRIYPAYPEIVALDGEVSNSTYSEIFKEAFPERFFEMYIAEQNMAGAALGLATRNKIPFVSSFAAFLSRAYDQIRMSQYSSANLKFCGSHAGVSIGEDGPSQMGLEDLAMFRTMESSVVLYPCDAVSTDRLVEEAAKYRGIVYIRTTRKDTPVIYGKDEKFTIGGCKVLRRSDSDAVTVVGAGITLHEAMAAYEDLKNDGISIRVIDLYSVKPVDEATLTEASHDTKAIITVEDHYPEGGIGDAVRSVLATSTSQVHCLAVTKMPKSGKPAELLDYEGISKKAIIQKIKEII
jgi:transketolase